MNETELIAVRYPNRRLAARLHEQWDQGRAVLPLSPALPDPEVARLLEAFRPARLEDPSGTTRLEGAVPVDPGTALVIATSGSSGEPKGVELTHDALAASGRAVNAALGDGRWLMCLPLTHIAGISILVRSRLSGTEPVIHDRFDLNAVATEHRAGLISLVPTALRRLLDAGANLARYRAVLVGGGPAAADLLDRARALGVQILQTYGLTETCGGCVIEGYPLEGVKLAVEEPDGQILVKGPVLMSKYRLKPELTSAVVKDGWLSTADLGALDQGKLTVFGRRDDMIITGGEKVAPAEVETLIQSHPMVADAAIAGISDHRWGEVVTALVVPRGDCPTVDDLKEFLSTRLPAYKIPKQVVCAENIPRNAFGKIQRRELLSMLRQ